MKLLIAIIIFILPLTSCRVTEKAIPGVYQGTFSDNVRLILNENKTFELSLSDPEVFYSKPGVYFNELTSGIWQLKGNKLVLMQLKQLPIDDSITRFTNISCFNFWNKQGGPISIRYILVPPSKLKPHFGNSLYFFSQDFKSTDTLTFFFDGYPPFRFPGSIPSTIGNNIHKVTLLEPMLNQQPQLIFIARKNKLIEPKEFSFVKERKGH